jgi:hypothetical protein
VAFRIETYVFEPLGGVPASVEVGLEVLPDAGVALLLALDDEELVPRAPHLRRFLVAAS